LSTKLPFSQRSTLRDLLLLLILCYAVFWWNLGKLGLIDPDEPFYALTGREMVASGDWMTPQIFGAPQFEKPILYYWMQGASYCAFGESEFAGRFPAALSATVLVLLTYGFARRVFNPRAGLIAGLFMAGGVICLMGRLMLTDIPLAVFVTASLFCYWLAVEEPERRNRWVFWHLFFSGLAVLTKGPIGSLIPLFATLSFTWFGRRPWVLRGRGLWFGLAAYSVIVFPWYGLMLVKHGWKFVDEFFYRDNWLRFIQAEHKSNNHFWYYPAVLLLGSIPWLPAALLAFRRLIGGLRTNPAMLFVACWFLPNLLFLTAAQSKLPSYGFYLFIPLAFMIGASLDSVLSHGFQTCGEKWMVIGAAVFQAAVLFAAPFLPAARPFALPVWAFAGMLIVACVALCFRQYRLWLGASVLSTVVFVGCIFTFAFEPLETMLSIRPVARKMVAMQKKGEPFLAGKFALRGIVYYTNEPVAVLSSSMKSPFWAAHPVEIIGGRKGLRALLEKYPSALCTMRRADWGIFSKSPAFGTGDPGQWNGESLLIRASRVAPSALTSPSSPMPEASK